VDTGASDGGYSDDANASDADPTVPNNQPVLKEFILTAIEQQIRKNNVKVASRMVKKTTKKAQIFKESSVVTLAIPAKLRRSTKPKRLPVRILIITRGSFTLISRFRRLKGGF
jgi:hypothetical protein